jgi:hypothetical protein
MVVLDGPAARRHKSAAGLARRAELVVAAVTHVVLSQRTDSVSQPGVEGPQQTTHQAAVEQVVAGYRKGDAALFMVLDTNQALWSTVSPTGGGHVVVNLIPDSKVSQATGLLDTSGLLHAYAVDNNAVLWVRHQTAWDMSLQQARCAPILSIDTNIQRVVTDASPEDAVSLFAIDVLLQGAVRFHYQHPTTHAWHSLNLLQPSEKSEGVPGERYRTEVMLLDANGNIVPSYPVEVKAASLVSVSVGTSTHMTGPTQPLSLNTDLFGRLTLATRASDVQTRELTFAAAWLS